MDYGVGYLLYLKLSLTGNEGEFIRRYRLDEPAFPHHSTADQFFNEAQFEAYRALGEHVGDKLFLRAIVGDLYTREDVTIEELFLAIAKSTLEAPAVHADIPEEAQTSKTGTNGDGRDYDVNMRLDYLR